jgi:hypothetical protein
LLKTWQHYAFNASGHKGQILKAFDINTTANEVYAHNHGKKQLAQVLSPQIFCVVLTMHGMQLTVFFFN